MRFSLLTLFAIVLLVSGFALIVIFPVMGMISSFNKIAETGGGGNPKSLAEGISNSLLPAVWGVVHVMIGIVLLVFRAIQSKKENDQEPMQNS